MDAKETSFPIASDNANLPPSIIGVQNGIVAFAMSQSNWTADGYNVKLASTSVVTTNSSTSWTALYDFSGEYPTIHSRTVADGTYVAQSSRDGGVCISAVESGSALSSSPQKLSFVFDESTGLYRIESGGLALEADGAKARLASPDGSLAQLREVTDAGGGMWTVSSAASGLALDGKHGRTAEGTEVWLYAQNGTAAQRWRLV